MKFKKVVITGESGFLDRYQSLFTAMSLHFDHLGYLPSQNTAGVKLSEKLALEAYKIVYKLSPSKADKLFYKNKQAFITKSQDIERRIRELNYTPDLIFHVFGMYCPLWKKFDIPYTMYLDYTAALAERNWSAWFPFTSREEREDWLECEQQAYERAYHLFTMGSIAKVSLIEDYGIAPKKITVIGSSGNFQEPYKGEKNFGTQQILFTGTDFNRKGGDLVLAAFRQVKETLPEAKLVIIGKKRTTHEDGIDNPGKIKSRSELFNLFLKTDLVVAPAYCDPFPAFLMEAMNYGIPCIVSNCDGMPEIVDHQVNGIVIDQPTPKLLAEHIIDLLSNPSKLVSMSHQARLKISTRLNWQLIAKRIVEVLSI